MNEVIQILVYFTFALFLIVFLSTSLAALILKHKFPDLWKAEGNPERWIYGNHMPKSKHFFNYLDEKRYIATGSNNYSRFCTSIKYGWYLFFFLFIISFIGVTANVLA